MKKLFTISFILFAIQSQAVQVYEKGIGGYIEFGQSLTKVETFYVANESEEMEVRSDHIAFTDINLHYVFQMWNVQFIPSTSIKT